jgi:sugar/nucleoside kinase (ribokinase family)
VTDNAAVPTVLVVGGAGAGVAQHLVRLGVRASLHATPEGTEPELARQAQSAALVYVALTADTRDLLPLVKKAGAPLWVDLADWHGAASGLHDPFVEAADCLFLSDIELADPLRTAERLLPGKELVVITHGKRGATAFFPDTEPFFVLPHDEGPVVSTGGARDAFCSGVAYGFVHGWDWPRSLHAGAVIAGGCVAVPEPVDPALSVEWLDTRLDERAT